MNISARILRPAAQLLSLLGLALSSPAAAVTDFLFADVTADRGIGGYVASVGDIAGVAAADYDNDGDIDIFVPTGAGIADQLYENDGFGSFTNIAQNAGVDSTDSHRVALFFDYDGDDLLDLAVAGDCYDPPGLPDRSGPCSVPTLILYRQTSPGFFADVSAGAGLEVQLTTGNIESLGGIAAGDIDNDGYLDIFISTWGQQTWLFLNNADGSFTDISQSSTVGIGPTDSGWQPMFHDWNGDGWADIYAAIDFNPNHLWINQGDKTFNREEVAAGLDSAFNEMGMTLGDADNDGDFDIFITNIFTAGKHNVLFRNDSVGALLDFNDVAAGAGVDATGWGWGTTFFDANNDGWLDLAATNGYRGIAGVEDDPSRFFLSEGLGIISFTDQSSSVGFDDTDLGSSLVAFDYNRDGGLDMLQTTVDGGPIRLLENQYTGAGSRHNHLVVKPRRQLGGNRRAIGAVVRASVGSKTYSRLITAGTSMAGQEPAEAFFGLGAATTVDSVAVEWPDGTVTTRTSVAAGQEITVLPDIENVIGSPSTTSTTSGPVDWTVSYLGADTVTLSPGDVSLITTGTATGLVGVSGSGTEERTVTVFGLTGEGSIRVQIAAGTGATSGGALTPAIPTSIPVTLGIGPGVPVPALDGPATALLVLLLLSAVRRTRYARA
jgi:hypothetical protein